MNWRNHSYIIVLYFIISVVYIQNVGVNAIIFSASEAHPPDCNVVICISWEIIPIDKVLEYYLKINYIAD